MPLETKGQIHLCNRRASNSAFVIFKTFTNPQARSKLSQIILSGETNTVLRNTFWGAKPETVFVAGPLGAFAKFRQTTVSVVMPACPSIIIMILNI